MKAIINTNLVMEEGIIFDGVILFDGGKITGFGKKGEVSVPDGAEIIDAHGKYTAPGLIDIHNHGAGAENFNENPTACAEHFIKHGETMVLPTLYMNLTVEQMIDGTEKIREASRHGFGKIIGGMYMEGPYMAPFGSNQKSIVWNKPISEEDYIPLVKKIGDFVRVWAIDPSRPKIDEFMKYVKSEKPDAIFALGHSAATAAECRRVHDLGVRVQTHHGDSGKAKGFAQGTIGAGCDEYTLYNPDMYAELICDQTGIHVAPDMLKMVVRTKGIERIILITDSMGGRGTYDKNNEAAGIAYGPDLNYDSEGFLAGSRLTLDNACRNFMVHTGYGICHAIRCATANPARMLGINDVVGTIECGKKANLIIIDDMIHVEKVFLDGELMIDNAGGAANE